MLQFCNIAVYAVLISCHIRSIQSQLLETGGTEGTEICGGDEFCQKTLEARDKIFAGYADENVTRTMFAMLNPEKIASMAPPTGIVSTSTKKCCGKYGCFTIEPPFGFTRCRPVMVLPNCQKELNVTFFLWTRENRENKDVIDPENLSTLTNSHFRKTNCVVVYVNGHWGYGDIFYILYLKDVVLDKEDCMFISVDWTKGSYQDTLSSMANIPMVASVLAYMIQTLQVTYGISLDIVHLIGHSLGAHIVAGAGKRLGGKIGRITGLDPAQPLFQNCDATVRLSNTDAQFVAVFHADDTFFGSAEPAGNVDIYVNGGYSQPGCSGFYLCNHFLLVFYYIDSFTTTCPYLAYQCDSMDNFMRGKCASGCGRNNSLTAPMSYYVDQWKHNSRPSPVLMYMSIEANQSYCVYHYYVEINCTDDQIRLWRYGRNNDTLYINLINGDEQTGYQKANQNSIQFNSMPNITTLITSKKLLQPQKVILKLVPSNNSELPSEDCQGPIEEPKDIGCCMEQFDAARGRCLLCPYIVKSIYVKNLETCNSATFAGNNKTLSPNEETSFDVMVSSDSPNEETSTSSTTDGSTG